MVETTTSTGTAEAAAHAASTAPAPAVPPTPEETLKGIVALLEKAVKLKETRAIMGRLMRQTAAVRKQLSASVLKSFLHQCLPAGLDTKAVLTQAVESVADSMQTDEDAGSAVCESTSVLPEVEMYAYLIVAVHLIDRKQVEPAKGVLIQALAKLAGFNRRTLDVIAARIYFYYSLAYELSGQLEEVRSSLLVLHRTAVLRHDSVGQETLLCLLLRNYLAYNQYDQAEKFRAKAYRQEIFRSNQQYCRYLFYLGRIRTIRLEYTDARDSLQQAARKAPTSTAHGFRVAVSKWLILVRLLLGEIPERSELVQPGLAAALRAYFELTQAVRHGDLKAFAAVAQKHEAVFRADGTHNLVTRLHHNVIRTGLRRINLAYSRISLKDVAEKLSLSSAEDAECIVAKAIRDGGIDATIDRAGGYMASREVRDVYSTAEPQAAFHARIAFCLDVHNDAVKAMRFEPDAHRRKLESAQARKERLAQEQELAKAIAEDDEGDEF